MSWERCAISKELGVSQAVVDFRGITNCGTSCSTDGEWLGERILIKRMLLRIALVGVDGSEAAGCAPYGFLIETIEGIERTH